MGDSVHGSSSSVSPTSETPENTAKFVHFPHKDFITFPQKIDKDKAEGKLRELNSKNGDTLNQDQGRKLIGNAFYELDNFERAQREEKRKKGLTFYRYQAF